MPVNITEESSTLQIEVITATTKRNPTLSPVSKTTNSGNLLTRSSVVIGGLCALVMLRNKFIA